MLITQTTGVQSLGVRRVWLGVLLAAVSLAMVSLPARAAETVCLLLEQDASAGCPDEPTVLTPPANQPFAVRAVFDPKGGHDSSGVQLDFRYPLGLGVPTCDGEGAYLSDLIFLKVDATKKKVEAAFFDIANNTHGPAKFLRCVFPASPTGEMGEFTWNLDEEGGHSQGIDELGGGLDSLVFLDAAVNVLPEVANGGDGQGDGNPAEISGDISLSVDMCNGAPHCTTIAVSLDGQFGPDINLALGFDVVKADDTSVSCLKASSMREAAGLNIRVNLPVEFDAQKCPGNTVVNVMVKNIPDGSGIAHLKDGNAFPCRRRANLDSLVASGAVECPLSSSARSGDADKDGKVDLRDLSRFKKAFNTTTGGAAFDGGADFNEDGKVDLRDLSLLKKTFGMAF